MSCCLASLSRVETASSAAPASLNFQTVNVATTVSFAQHRRCNWNLYGRDRSSRHVPAWAPPAPGELAEVGLGSASPVQSPRRDEAATPRSRDAVRTPGRIPGGGRMPARRKQAGLVLSGVVFAA